MSSVQIGTSGWQYAHWKGHVYPENLSKVRYLSLYAERFQTLEINSSFYHLPQRPTFEKWHDETPDGFVFAVKANRYITHMKKLKDAKEPVTNLVRATEGLGEKVGPILFQLPPRWYRNVERLRSFLATLPEERRFVFEFRDASWFDEEVYEALREKNAAFCIYDLNGTTSPKTVTADFVYIRLHGPGKAYQGEYGPHRLAGWAGAISTWSRKSNLDVFCYFDNDQKGFAVRDADILQTMVR